MTPETRTPLDAARDAVVRAAEVWAGYIGTVAEGSASYTRNANRLSDAVDHYVKLRGYVHPYTATGKL